MLGEIQGARLNRGFCVSGVGVREGGGFSHLHVCSFFQILLDDSLRQTDYFKHYKSMAERSLLSIAFAILIFNILPVIEKSKIVLTLHLDNFGGSECLPSSSPLIIFCGNGVDEALGLAA